VTTTAAAAREFAIENVHRCPLCGSVRLRPFGTAPQDPLTLHAQQSRCDGCGVLLSNPRVREPDRDRYYQDRYYELQWPDADRVLQENLATHAAHDVSLIERLSGPRLPRQARALDVGAGYGATVETLRRRGYRAVGCEMSWRGCAFAHSHGLAVVRGKAPALPFADGAFDLVISAHVIEHVGDPKAFVCDLARVVKPGGVLALVTDHAVASQHTWNRMLARATFRVPPFQTSTDHTFVFGTKHLRHLLAHAGCTPLDVVVYHHGRPRESWHWRAYKSTFRFIDRLLGWGPYQLALGVRG
jgi:SAM-dependent methyltransferase